MTSEETKYNTWCKKARRPSSELHLPQDKSFGDVMLCPFVNNYWHFEGMLRQAATAWP